jgi:ATP-dependent helicase/nuclease subunit B
MRGLFTIPAGTPFLDALAEGVLAQTGGDPAILSATRIFLPTRRACQVMADAFLRVTDGRALLLPKLEPLGDLDPEDWHEPASAAAATVDLPPAIGQTRRRLLLAQLIIRRGDTTADQALRLAEALGQWLDQVQIHDLDTANLAGIVADDYASHWAETLKFLAIVTEYWPSILRQEGVMDPVLRRRAVIQAQIEAWQHIPPTAPVIAAGSTGSLPATADLMRAVLALPQGSVVLPGLDIGLPSDAWELLPDGHPQHGLGKLLESLHASPTDVSEWPHGRISDRHDQRQRQGRATLLRQSLLPASMDASAADIAETLPGLNGLLEVAAPGPEAEARVIALRLREFLSESVTETASLVTSDRSLARRVAAELARWGIAIDDSAGEPLTETPPGVFLRLVSEAAVSKLAPVPLLALLKHPLAHCDRNSVETLEREALRGLRPGPGVAGIRAGIESPAIVEALNPLLARLEQALEPLLTLVAAETAPLTDWLTAHIQAAEAMAATEEQDGASRLWADEAGEAAASALDGLLAAAPDFPGVKVRDYQAVFEELTDSQKVRPRFGKHPRLSILGPLEARLQCPDLAILGGLNEGSWPPEPERDPWMGRPMRKSFGLPPPEWRIGLAAHDFCQAMAAPEVMMTRAERVDGTPTVPARWLSRLELIARQATTATGDDDANPLQTGSSDWLAWQEALDRADVVSPLPLPMPMPPVEHHFKDLSVSNIEQWVNDPYGHYARSLLKLRALDPLDQPPDASERGQLIHSALQRFIAGLGEDWPANAEQRLQAIGREVFAELLNRPSVQAFWWPRFLRMVAWFCNHQAQHWPGIVAVRTEHQVSAPLAAGQADITIRARLDRLDQLADGGYAIIDYKSGTLPATNAMPDGWPPQLPIEAALVQRETGGPVASLEAWAVGGNSEGGQAKNLTDKVSPSDAAEAAWDGLARLLVQFSAPDMPYLAEPRPSFAPHYSDYRHLARIDREGGGDE